MNKSWRSGIQELGDLVVVPQSLFHVTPENRTFVLRQARVLTLNEASIFPAFYLHFIFLLSFTPFAPFVYLSPVSPAFHLAPCPSTFLYCFLSFPSHPISFLFSFFTHHSCLLFHLSLTRTCNVSSDSCNTFFSSFLTLTSALLLPVCLAFKNMKINE